MAILNFTTGTSAQIVENIGTTNFGYSYRAEGNMEGCKAYTVTSDNDYICCEVCKNVFIGSTVVCPTCGTAAAVACTAVRPTATVYSVLSSFDKAREVIYAAAQTKATPAYAIAA